MARIDEGSQFYLPPIRLSTNGMSHPIFTLTLLRRGWVFTSLTKQGVALTGRNTTGPPRAAN